MILKNFIKYGRAEPPEVQSNEFATATATATATAATAATKTLVVANVASVAVAKFPKHNERWQLFVEMAMSHDVTAEQVQSMFTLRDIDDLLAERDEKLPLHARTIAEAIHRRFW